MKLTPIMKQINALYSVKSSDATILVYNTVFFKRIQFNQSSNQPLHSHYFSIITLYFIILFRCHC